MDDLEDFNYKLLANRGHHKKVKVEILEDEENLDDQIFLLLEKKFPGINVKTEDYSSIFLKIDFVLMETTIKNTFEDTINSIIDDIII